MLRKVSQACRAILRDENGQTMLEYVIIIVFVVVALVVYVVTSLLLRAAPEAPAPPTKTCQFCKETVPADATKCRACTSAI